LDKDIAPHQNASITKHSPKPLKKGFLLNKKANKLLGAQQYFLRFLSVAEQKKINFRCISARFFGPPCIIQLRTDGDVE